MSNRLNILKADESAAVLRSPNNFWLLGNSGMGVAITSVLKNKKTGKPIQNWYMSTKSAHLMAGHFICFTLYRSGNLKAKYYFWNLITEEYKEMEIELFSVKLKPNRFPHLILDDRGSLMIKDDKNNTLWKSNDGIKIPDQFNITDIEYKLNEGKVLSIDKIYAKSINIANDTSVVQTDTYTRSIIHSETKTWQHNTSLSSTNKVTAKCPYLADIGLESTIMLSSSLTLAENTTSTLTETINVPVTVLPKRKVIVDIILTEGKIQVPYVLKVECKYKGEVYEGMLDYIFEGVNAVSIVIEYHEYDLEGNTQSSGSRILKKFV